MPWRTGLRDGATAIGAESIRNPQSMIPKSGDRFSEKIMLHQ
jgi:hypothetical protein